MSLLAGFDFVTEISNATFAKIFKANAQIGGVPLNPPFQLTLAGGTAQLIVDDLQLDFQGDDSLDISFAFSRSSVELPREPGTLTIRRRVIVPLDGVIVINVLVKLVPGFSTQRDVIGDMSSATVRIVYSAAAEQLMESRLGDDAVAGFKSFIVDSLTDLVRSEPNVPFGYGFPVVPGTDGKLTPSLQFSNLQIRCVGHPDRSRQALCLLGNFFASTQNNGNRIHKTETAIAPGEDFTTTLSRRTVHSLIFCRNAAESLAPFAKEETLRDGVLPVASLPASCGSARSLPLSRVVLTSLLDTYTDGAILVSGTLEKSGFCYEVTGSFNGRVEVAVAANRTALTFKSILAEPQVDVSIDWYCALAGFAVHPIALEIAAYVENLMARFVSMLATSALSGSLLSGPVGADQLARAGATFSSVALTPTHLNIQGKVALSVPFVETTRSVSLTATSSTVELTAATRGEWVTKLSCQPEKSYTYTETQQKQVGTYDLVSRFVTLPLSVTYSIRGGERGIGGLPAPSGPSIPLPPASRLSLDRWMIATVPNVDCLYPFPLGTGGTIVTQDVHIDYRISGTQIELANREPSEGNFFLLLHGAVLDGIGAPSPGAAPTLWILFEGHRIGMDDEYLRDQLECEIWSIADLPTKYLPTWDFEFDPSPAWRTLAQFRALNQMQLHGALQSSDVDTLLLESQIAHGDAMTRIHRAASDVPVGQERRAIDRAVAANAIEDELRSQVRVLKLRLAELERLRR